MCGISGVWQREGGVVDQAQLDAMNACVQHRGPDDAGIYTNNGIGLAHRRLSVLDVSTAGHQPMSTPDGRYVLVFNGEIYNYKELAEQYLAEVRLQSDSDTEVLLHLLARRGTSILPELRGMFAFAFWDNQAAQLLLARDPFGKKPLYYAVQNDTVWFASEVKSLLQHPAVPRQIDPGALTKYFLYEYVPAPATGWQGITQVPLGSVVTVTKESVVTNAWWRPVFRPKATASEKQLLRQLDGHLETAVARRMVADVPVGVFLSGGLDSSTIAWYMQAGKAAGEDPVHSYSVGFTEQSYDESSFAQEAAAAVGTTHHQITFGLDDFKQAATSVIPHMDIPFADPSLLPTWLVSRAARRHMVVALDGDGSDELLGGYGTFQAAVASQRLPALSSAFWQSLSRAAESIPTSYRYFSWDFKLKSFLRGMPYPLARRHQVWLGSFTDRDLRQLLTPEYRQFIAGLFDDVDELAKAAEGLNLTDTVSSLLMHHYLHNGILVKLDRATMLTSLEARTPFLDVDLAEWLMKLPAKYKRDKYILKQLMRGRLPRSIVDRRKQGFAMPLGGWLRGPLAEWMEDVLAPQRVKRSGMLQASYVAKLMNDHRQGKADHRKKLWTLLMFQLWWENWAQER